MGVVDGSLGERPRVCRREPPRELVVNSVWTFPTGGVSGGFNIERGE